MTETLSKRFLDVRRTDLHQRFFQTYRYRLASEILEDIERLPLDQDAFGRSADARSYGYSGWLYWLMYLKGYTQYAATGSIMDDNVYYRYLTLRYAAQDADPTMRSLTDPLIARERIARRFSDCDRLIDGGGSGEDVDPSLPALTAFVRSPPAEEDTLKLFEVGAGQPILARLMDGHHRLFAARLFGVKRLGLVVHTESTVVPDLAGKVDCIGIPGDRLAINGWVESPSSHSHCVELRSGEHTICRAPLGSSAVALSDATREGAHRFTFSIDVATSAFAKRPLHFDIMVLENWLPVGKLRCNLGENG
jgi:hypothetical protein